MMPKYIDIDDDRNCYIGNNGEYERYNIDPDVLDEAVEIIRCKDCVLTDGHEPIADGRYWCMLHRAYMYYCSAAERRTDET